MALTAGTTAWALAWWGGADGIVLLALALRCGMAGLVAGSLAAVAMGLALMVVRRRSLQNLLAAVPGVLALRQARAFDEGIPARMEMPAAAALAVAGMIVEVIRLWQMCG